MLESEPPVGCTLEGPVKLSGSTVEATYSTGRRVCQLAYTDLAVDVTLEYAVEGSSCRGGRRCKIPAAMRCIDPGTASVGTFRLEGDAAYSSGDPEEGWERQPLKAVEGDKEAVAGLKRIQKARC